MGRRCRRCGERMADPSLAAAVLGFDDCTECEERHILSEYTKLETLYGIEQRIHLLERRASEPPQENR